ncbi:MAG: DUF2817 domain-containing protein [Candidatus Aminicenantes bacterium]|nr:DUF2817 domain-containing protein [Candidatus Aminicenantes bacterium]
MFRRSFALALIILFSLGAVRAGVNLKTPAEENRYTSYTQYEDVVKFLSRVKARSQNLKVKIIGRTKEVNRYPARDLFLAVLTEEGVSEPEELNHQKPTILFIASQHGNEQSAKEAALRLLRDVALGELNSLLKKVNILIIPQANPYGNFFDVRQNEVGLDLNRDHVKLEAESTRAIHRAFALYQPEVTMDLHEKGDDYYRVSVGCVSNLNIHPSLQSFSRQVILREIEKKLEKKKITFFEYLVSEPLGLDTSSGARISAEATREMMLRYSTTDLNDGRNSFGIYETLSFIQEVSSRHDLATLETRTGWQYEGIRALVEIVASRPDEIRLLVRNLRTELLKRARQRAEDDPVHLRMRYERDPAQLQLVIKAFERPSSPIRGILKVDKKAGDYLLAEDIAPYMGPADYKVVTRLVKNWFPLVKSELTVKRPAGYIIPAERFDLVEVLLSHGLKVQMLEKAATVEVGIYRVKELVPARADYLPPEKITVELEKQKVALKRGDFIISCEQPGANLIPCLLEPQSEYGLIRYFKFKLVPEVDDYYQIYRLEVPLALSAVDLKNW